MSKAKTVVRSGASIGIGYEGDIDPRRVCWLQDEQSTERWGAFGDPLVDLLPLLSQGWDSQKGNLHVTPLQDGDVERARAQLTDYCAKLAQRKTITLYTLDPVEGDNDKATPVTLDGIAASQRVAAFYGDAWTPEVKGNSGFRRGSVVALAALSWGQRFNRDPREYLVRVTCKGYADPLARLEDRVSENQLGGRKVYSLLGYFGIACEALRLGANETRFGRMLPEVSRGKGARSTLVQDAWARALLADRYDDLQLAKRWRTEKPDTVVYTSTGWLPISKYHHTDIRAVLGTAREDSKISRSVLEVLPSGTYTVGVPATSEQVERWSRLIVEGGNAVPMLGKKQVDTLLVRLGETFDKHPLKRALLAISKGDVDALAAVVAEVKMQG